MARVSMQRKTSSVPSGISKHLPDCAMSKTTVITYSFGILVVTAASI